MCLIFSILTGYGGFQVSLLPVYDASIGLGWLEKGNIYVYANIRGGGEMGPSWHQASLKEKRHTAYEDFIAVAEDLIAKGWTQSKRLGIRGGSNGGLLVGNMQVRFSDTNIISLFASRLTAHYLKFNLCVDIEA
jgi:prolyl oligopeptidase